MSETSVASDKDDDQMIPGALYRSLGICLTAKQNPGKPQLGYRLMKAVRWGPLPLKEVGSIAQHMAEGMKGKKERIKFMIIFLV